MRHGCARLMVLAGDAAGFHLKIDVWATTPCGHTYKAALTPWCSLNLRLHFDFGSRLHTGCAFVTVLTALMTTLRS